MHGKRTDVVERREHARRRGKNQGKDGENGEAGSDGEAWSNTRRKEKGKRKDACTAKKKEEKQTAEISRRSKATSGQG